MRIIRFWTSVCYLILLLLVLFDMLKWFILTLLIVTIGGTTIVYFVVCIMDETLDPDKHGRGIDDTRFNIIYQINKLINGRRKTYVIKDANTNYEI